MGIMKFKIGFMLFILVAAMAAPYFIKGRDGKPLMQFKGSESLDIISTEQTRQEYLKWQDEKGVWHFGEKAPEGVTPEVVNVDTAANIIRSVRIEKEEPEEPQEQTAEASAPSLPVPMTVDPEKVSDMINQANNVENLLNERTKQLEGIR
jgi:hypothetical protein